MYDPPGRDAAIVRQALSANIDVKAATEVICSRTHSQIQHFKQLYYARFGTYLEQDIEYQTSGDHKKVLTFSLFLSLVSDFTNHCCVHICVRSSMFLVLGI